MIVAAPELAPEKSLAYTFENGLIKADVKQTTTQTVVKTETKQVEKAEVKVTEAYKRPNNATTPAQRASVQGKPCVSCGEAKSKMVADHKTPLVKEHYQTGTIDKTKMKSTDAVQPQCPTCSAKQGAEMSQYSKEMLERNDVEFLEWTPNNPDLSIMENLWDIIKRKYYDGTHFVTLNQI